MLHAFNQKNVRRILLAGSDEHKNDKNEDAITSMVFSPLAFMSPDAALQVMAAVVGSQLQRQIGGRAPRGHDARFWQTGLKARAWNGGGKTAVAPDLTVQFDFEVGPPILVVCEMKWDWSVTPEHLNQEIRRQWAALRDDLPGCVIVPFVLTKYRLNSSLADVSQATWVQVQQAAGQLARNAPGTPAGRWGHLVSAFLHKAEQTDFQGFKPIDFRAAQTTALSMTVESGPRIFAQKEPRLWVDGGHDGERPIRRSWSGLHSLIGRGSFAFGFSFESGS